MRSKWLGLFWAALALCLPGAALADDLADLVHVDPVAALAAADARLAGAAPPAQRAAALAVRALALSQMGRRDEALATLGKAAPPDEATRAELLFARSIVLGHAQDYAAAEAPAHEARAIRARLWGEDDARVAMIDASLGMLMVSQGKAAEALPQLARAWDIMREALPPGDSDRAAAGHYYATALSRLRRAEQAETLLRQLARDAALLPAGHSLRARVPIGLGTELLMQGRIAQAVPLLRAGVDQGAASRSLQPGEIANALSVLGSALLQQDRPELALDVLRAAADRYGAGGLLPGKASALIAAGSAADRTGDRAAGLALREEALAILQGLPRQSELGMALARFKLAQSLAHAGRLAEAEEAEAAAVETLARLRPESHFQVTNSRIALGWMEVLRGRTASGLERVRQAFRLSVAANDQLEAARNQVVGVLDNVEAYSQALEAARLAGDPAFAFEVMQVMVETDASRAAVAVTRREQAGEGALGDLLRRRQEAASSPDPAGALARIDAELDARFPEFRVLLRPRRVSLDEARRGLAADEALLVIVESDLGLYTMGLTRAGVALGHAPLRRHAIRALVGRLRAGVDAGADGFDVAAARALHDAVFTAPVAALLRPGMRLRIASGDILSALPPALMVSRGTTLGDARFLIEDHAVSAVASLAGLAVGAPEAVGGGRLVAIGAPAGLERGLAPRPPLPGADREIARIAALMRRQKALAPLVLTGPAATEAAVRSLDLSDTGVLLFATHALAAGAIDVTSEPALLLSPPDHPQADDDGLLTASEAATLRTDAQWVILSACDTAGGDAPDGASYSGLARAFLFAGARRVVASHWPVRDDISARISYDLVRGARGRTRPDEALRRAMLGVMRDSRLPDARNPAIWAPFTVMTR